MRFSDIVGQEAAIARIRAAVAVGRLPHAWLFHGRSGVGKTTAALALARLMQCAAPRDASPCEACPSCHKSLHFNHPDIFLMPPTPSAPDTQAGDAQRTDFIAATLADMRKAPIFVLDESRPLEHRIRSMRWLKQEASRAAVDGPWKVFILKRAGLMNPEAANAILKLLEEPNPGTFLILCAERPGELPDTIKSRCALVRFSDLNLEHLIGLLETRLKAEPETIRLAARVAQGSLTRAAALVDEDVLSLRDEVLGLATSPPGDPEIHDRMEAWLRTKDKSRLDLFFDLLLLWFSDLLRVSVDAADERDGLANSDRLPELKAWARRVSHSDILDSIREVEKARAAIVGYGYLPLVLYSLLEQLPRGPALRRPVRGSDDHIDRRAGRQDQG